MTKRHHCANCGEDIGAYDRRYCEPTDTCGKQECERAVRDDIAAQRADAHDQFDRDNGWA